MKEIMICGIDCVPGGKYCNNYCNQDKSKPMADKAPRATEKQKLAWAKTVAQEKLREAEKAWYEYFCMCEVGDERTRAADVYENVRTATRIG